MSDPPRRRPVMVTFDRDGVLNVDHGYAFEPDELAWAPGFLQSGVDPSGDGHGPSSLVATMPAETSGYRDCLAARPARA